MKETAEIWNHKLYLNAFRHSPVIEYRAQIFPGVLSLQGQWTHDVLNVWVNQPKKPINALSTSYQLQLTALCIVFTLISASPSRVHRNTFRIHQTKEQKPFKPTHCAHLQKVHSRSTWLDQRGRGASSHVCQTCVMWSMRRNRDAAHTFKI